MPRLWPTGGLWRHRDFLKLWSAETISQFGAQVDDLAIGFVAIVELDASAFEVALLGALGFLPFILFTLPAGVWVDRVRRRPILDPRGLRPGSRSSRRSRSRTSPTR